MQPPPPPAWTPPVPPYPVAPGAGYPYGAATGYWTAPTPQVPMSWAPSPSAYPMPPPPATVAHAAPPPPPSGSQGVATMPVAVQSTSSYGSSYSMSAPRQPPPPTRGSSYYSASSSSSSSWLNRKRPAEEPAPLSSKKAKGNEFVEARKRLQQGLKTPLSDDNRGLKLLKMMGYKEGQSLGNKEGGAINPAEIDLFQQRQGLGYLEEKREKDQRREEEERMRKEQKALRAARSQSSSLSAYMRQQPGSEPEQAVVPFDPYRPADRQPGAASASAPSPSMGPGPMIPWNDVNEGTQKVDRWRESVKDLLAQFFRPPNYDGHSGFQANLITDECRRCIRSDLPWLLGKYTGLYQRSVLGKEHTSSNKIEKYYVTGKARRAILVRDGQRPVGFIVILLEPARKWRMQMPIFHIEEEYRRQGYDTAVLYLLAKMIMQGHGDIQGLTCHMLLEEEPPEPGHNRHQGGPRGLIRWREMGADVEWTDKGPMVSFTLYRLRSLHDSYRGPPVQLHPT